MPPPWDRGKERAAASADLHHLHHRDLQRHAAALHEAMGPVGLEAAPGRRAAVVDQADLGRGAAHVEAQEPLLAQAAGQMGGQHGAAGRPRFDQPHREGACRRQRHQAAGRGHHQDRRPAAGGMKPRLHIGQIARHGGLDIGVGDGGGLALVFAHLRAHLAGERKIEGREAFGHHVGEAPLMGRVGIGVKQADGDAFHPHLLDAVEPGRNPGLVQRHQHLAGGVDPLLHRPAQAARRQRRRAIGHDVVLVEAVFPGDGEAVAVALGDEQRRHRALALDQAVGGQRGAVEHQVDRRGFQPGLAQRRQGAGHEAFGRGGGRGRHLGGGERAGAIEHDIGEGAADIDGEADGHGPIRRR